MSQTSVRGASSVIAVSLCGRQQTTKTDACETGHNDNANRLRTLGFEARLRDLRDDSSIDVRERVRDALEACFEPDTGPQGMLVD